MRPRAATAAGAPGERCITCSDEGVAMTVVEVQAGRGLALCAEEGGARRAVETALVAPLSPGERVLVHAGVAIATLPAAGEPGGERA